MQAKQRKCIACRESKPQSEMLRVARINDEYVDRYYKLAGISLDDAGYYVGYSVFNGEDYEDKESEE